MTIQTYPVDVYPVINWGYTDVSGMNPALDSGTETFRMTSLTDSSKAGMLESQDSVQSIKEFRWTWRTTAATGGAVLRITNTFIPQLTNFVYTFQYQWYADNSYYWYITYYKWTASTTLITPTLTNTPSLNVSEYNVFRLRVNEDGSMTFDVKAASGDENSWVLLHQTAADFHPLYSVRSLISKPSIYVTHYYTTPAVVRYTYTSELKVEGLAFKTVLDTNWVNYSTLSATHESFKSRFLEFWGLDVYLYQNSTDAFGSIWVPTYFKYPVPEITYIYSGSYWQFNTYNNFVFTNAIACTGDVEFKWRHSGGGTFNFRINGVLFEIGCFETWFVSGYGYYTNFGMKIDGVYTGITYNMSQSYTQECTFSLIGNTCILDTKLSSSSNRVIDTTDFLGSPPSYRFTNFEFKCTISLKNVYYIRLLGRTPVISSDFNDIRLSPVYSNFDLSWTPPPIVNSGYFIFKSELTGGGIRALDGIDPLSIDGSNTPLTENSSALVVTDQDEVFVYRARNSSGQSESLPNIIVPDNNTGNWWWELINVKAFRPAKAFQYTDLNAGGTFDYDYYADMLCTTFVPTSDSKIIAAAVGVTPASGIYSLTGQLTGKTNILALPYIPIKTRV